MHTKCTVAANSTEQMNNKTNHTVNTLRRGTLTIYHKSASGEKQQFCCAVQNTERQTEKRHTHTHSDGDTGLYTITQTRPRIRLIKISIRQSQWRCYTSTTGAFICV